MNKAAVLHIPLSQYSFAYGERELRLRLRTGKGDADEVRLIYAVKYDWLTDRKTISMRKSFSDDLYDYYTVALDVPDSRIGYVFHLSTGGGEYYYSEEGLTRSFDHAKGYYSFFQYPYINSSDVHGKIGWCREAVFYQIFIDRFCRGDDNKNLSYINKKWGELPEPKDFFGGDLKGIIGKLPYLHDLGVTGIYLTPLFLSPSNHKYDTIDYFRIDPMFGCEEDLKTLVREAHSRGMKVILDAVFNHCSSRCAQFSDVLKRGKGSPYFDWFIIRGDFPDLEKRNYECFAACSYMPKWNTNNPQVQEFLLEVTKKWQQGCNIDGWRLDVADEVSHEFWRRFRREVKGINKDAVIIGESWHNASPWLRGDEFDGIMNYSFTKACIDYFAEQTRTAQEFCDRLSEILMRNTDQVNEMMFNLLDSHDTERFLTLVGENREKMKCALAVLFFFPGMPCLCYGTEIGMRGGYEPDSRRAFDWDERHWDKDIFQTVRSLIALKKQKIRGGVRMYAQGDLFVIEREAVGLAVNNTEHASVFFAPSGEVSVQPHSYVIWERGTKK